jgi:DNA repair protein RecO (recombination protein O)
LAEAGLNMQASATAIICFGRPHGEAGAIVRALTEEHGLLAGYVQGARGRMLRPVLIPGNVVKGAWRARVAGQLPSLSVEPIHSRAHLLGEPLATAAIEWACALTAATLPEAHPYPRLYSALDGLLSAVELAPAARGWAQAMARYEALLLSELGYGGADNLSEVGTSAALKAMAENREALIVHVLGDKRADIIAARERLVERLKRAVA